MINLHYEINICQKIYDRVTIRPSHNDSLCQMCEPCASHVKSLMGNDIGLGVSLKAICFNFRSTNVGSSVIGTRSTSGFDVFTL